MKKAAMVVGLLAMTQLVGCATQSNSSKVYRAGEAQVEQSIR